jgi:aldehyde dehydrogenase (NAD+)
MWNDVILPTVDPRLPFLGTGKSGYGATRGREGLLAMTRPKVLTETKGKVRRHYAIPGPTEQALFEAVIQAGHTAGRQARFRGFLKLIRTLFELAAKERS